MLKTKLLFNKLTLFFLLIGFSVSATDITVEVGDNIQDAIDTVNSDGGGIVTLGEGTHVVTETLEMKSNVTLQGSGIYASTIQIFINDDIIAQDGYSDGDTNSVNDILIQNLTLIGINGDEGGGIQITQQNTDNENITVSSVRCYRTGWGVHIKGAKNVLIEDCDFSENGAVGQEGYAHNLYLRRVYGAVVRNSTLNNSISANGINISYSEDVEIYDCEMIGNYFRGVRAANSDGYLVHDCIITDNGDVGLFANSEGVVTINIDWQNNCVANNDKGIRALSGATGVCYNNNSYGNSDDDYDLPSAVTESDNISDSSIECKSIDSEEEELTTDGTLVHITKRNATGYAIDGGTGGENGQSVTLSSANTSDEGQLWLEIDRGDGYYSYEKYGTNYSLDGDGDGANNQIVYLWETNDTNQNQQWEKEDQGDGSYKLIKRNATGYTINGGSGAVEGRNITLWDSSVDNQNLQWYITPVATDIRIEAEDYDEMSGVQTEDTQDTDGVENVGYINDGDWLRFDDINLSGITNMDARVASKTSSGIIEVRIGSSTGTLIGSITVGNTGGFQSWETTSTTITSVIGTQDIYLVFTGDDGYLFNINWIEFNTNSTSNKAITAINQTTNVVIYPNPVVSTTTIQGAANSIVTIYDMNGGIVFAKFIFSESEIIDLSGLSVGMYHADISNDLGKTFIKLVKN